MISKVWSSTTLGVDAIPVEIEVSSRSGVPKYRVVGLPHGAVKESLDRVLTAIRNSELPWARGRITINLAPADLRKESPGFDLPIAVGLLSASDVAISQELLNNVFVTGELALDGTVRPVRGVLPMALCARGLGFSSVIVPRENAEEAAIVEGLHVYPVSNLEEVFGMFTGRPIAAYEKSPIVHSDEPRFGDLDFSDVCGQETVKRALEVGAAGGHNTIMIGPPGSGKTMLAKRMPTILPPPTAEEALETTKIHSVGGALRSGKVKRTSGLVTTRPFRAPHHTISDAGLCGGGANPKPGEISLAHNGVLFLDELPEFKRQVLEVLRQPMEDGSITISRSQFTVDYPARFMLVASMNPCPCGHLNDPNRDCVCSPIMIQRYMSRISGPLMDRIDMHVEVTPVAVEKIGSSSGAESSATVRARVIAARQIQEARFAGYPSVFCNAQMGTGLTRRHCKLGNDCQILLRSALRQLGLSARAFDRIVKVARTIGDLSKSERIRPEHIAEAIQYRSLDRSWWSA